MLRSDPPEFRRRAVELARLREEPIAQIASDLGNSESCLRNWVHQADVDEWASQGLSTEERAEMVQLRGSSGSGTWVRDPQAALGVLRTGERPPNMACGPPPEGPPSTCSRRPRGPGAAEVRGRGSRPAVVHGRDRTSDA